MPRSVDTSRISYTHRVTMVVYFIEIGDGTNAAQYVGRHMVSLAV